MSWVLKVLVRLYIPDDIVSFSIAQNGDIIGVNADGATVNTGQKIGVVKVINPAGLEKIGGNLYQMTANANPDGCKL